MTESAPAANNHSALLHGEAVFRVAFDEAPVGVIITDLNLRFMRVNREICRFLGFSAEELLALHVPDITHPDDLSKDLQQAQQLAAGLLDKFTMDKRYIRKDGQIVWGRLSARLVRDPAAQPLYLLAIIEDISQRMHAEEALHKLNRTLRALSKSSQAMLRAKDESAFVQEVCEIIVRDCGHRMAWVGYARHDEDQSVEPVAWAGAEDGYLQTVNITWADTERGRGPSGTAIRTGRAIISNNFATDPSFGPWRTAATQRGYASSIALPLLAEGHAFAALMIYSGQPAPFSAEEVRLLEELAEDLAYGITVLRLRAAHDRAEQALRQSHERMQRVLEVETVGVMFWDLNTGCLIDANDTFLKMMGYTRGDVEAHDLTWQKFTPPEFHEVSRAEVAKFMATGRVGPYEKEYFRKDGSRQWLLFAGSSLGNNQCVEFCVDIGQLKQTEDALRFLAQCANAPGRDFFQELARYLAETLAMDFVCIDSLHDGLLVAQTLAMYFDGKFDPNVSYTLQDTPCGDVVGKSICCFPHGVRHRFPKDEVLQNMLAESYVGTTLWNAQGQPIGLIAVIGRKPLLDTRLATSILQLVAVRAAGELERRQAEEALAAAKAAAEAANQAKDHFLAALSHELRTPLSPALMLVTTHENNPEVPDPVRLDLATVRHNIELEVRIIDDLLDLSRVTSGKMRMHPQNVSVREVLRQAIGTCAADITGRNLQLHQEFTATHDLVHADPARLQQVFWNLLKNAVKFTPTGGRLKVTCQNVNMDRVQVRVQDSGIGIPPDSLARIFEAFEQADKNITRQFGGLGLGLAISKAIVDLHGGSIRAESAGQGQGATFTVELPITHTAPPPQRTAASSTPADAPRQLRLLLVEDHADTARTLARLLRASGHHVQTADSLAAARTLLAQERFDLLLSDLGLPDGTGYDLMQHAKAAYAIPGICMSGFGMETDIERSRQAGFAAHLTKPIHIQQLEQTIHQVASRLAPPISPPPQQPRA